jgi:hypothetical protein
MVYLELGIVTGCFHRDRDRQQAYPLPPEKPGLDRKSLTVWPFMNVSARPGSGRWQICRKAASHPWKIA